MKLSLNKGFDGGGREAPEGPVGHFGIHSTREVNFRLQLFASCCPPTPPPLKSLSMPILSVSCSLRCHCWELEAGSGMGWRMSFALLRLYWVPVLPYSSSCPRLWVQRGDLHVCGSWFRESLRSEKPGLLSQISLPWNFQKFMSTL